MVHLKVNTPIHLLQVVFQSFFSIFNEFFLRNRLLKKNLRRGIQRQIYPLVEGTLTLDLLGGGLGLVLRA